MKLIRHRGGADVSLGDVATAARLSRQAIYLHFEDRADLLISLVQHVDEMRGLGEKLRGIRAAPSGVEAVREIVALQAQDNPILWPIALFFDTVRRSDAAVERAWQDRLNHRLEECRAVIARLQKEKMLRRRLDPATAADILWTMTSLRMWEDLVLLRGWSADQYARQVTEMLRVALIGERERG